jgi:hypothetical protein
VPEYNICCSAVKLRGLCTNNNVKVAVVVEVSCSANGRPRIALNVHPNNGKAHGVQKPQSHIRDRLGDETEYNVTYSGTGLPIGIGTVCTYHDVGAAVLVNIADPFYASASGIVGSSASDTQTSSSGNKGNQVHIAVWSRASEHNIGCTRVRARAIFHFRADNYIVPAVVVEISGTAH